MLNFIWKYSKLYLFTYSCLTLIDGVFPLVGLYTPKLLIDMISQRRKSSDIFLLLGIYFAIGLCYFVITYTIRGKYLQPKSDMLHNYISLKLKYKVANLDMRYLEDPKYHDLLERASKVGQGEGTNLIHQLFSLLSNIISLTTISFIIFRINIWVVIVALIVVIINAILNTKSRQVEIKIFNDLAPNRRQIGYNIGVLADPRFSKEIRIFNLQDWIAKKATSLIKSMIGNMKKSIWKMHKYVLIGSVSNIVQEVLLFLMLGLQTLKKQITIGDFVLYVNSISRYSGLLNEILGSVIQINTSGQYVDNFKRFLDLENNIITKDGDKIQISNNYEIKFENVSFQYPGHEHHLVLKDVTVELKPGLKYAIVGPNGAGKTTFVKLLLRLYDPTEGKILINGVNIADINHLDYQKNFSVVFQDYQSFAYTIKENIILNEKYDSERLFDSINEAGLAKKINSLKNGVNTNLQKIFDPEGIEFSGGELQKLAIARCLYRQSHIYILDEPSAALDPFAEKEIYESIMKLRRESTVIFITHRLTSVKRADVILYMENGEILEKGTHDELMAMKGRYSVLYKTQAEQYI